HIERMENELKDLETKIKGLNSFLGKEFENKELTSEMQRVRMSLQLEHMLSYRDILKERIFQDSEKNN
ncbi:MAG: crAss001_48 related protein, partial [Fusobacteriaceae bacterium]